MVVVASPPRGLPCSPSKRASQVTPPASLPRGVARTAAGGEASTAATRPAMSSGFASALQTRTCTGIHVKVTVCLLSLEHLEHLDLSMNCLSGPNDSFPVFLGQMRNLRYLNLTGLTMFTGRVPPQLGNLSKMQYLSIGQAGSRSQMYSDDITWLTNLHLLQHVSIGGINLSGIHDWPHTLNMIPSLRVISLSDCSLQSANQSLPYLNLTRLEKLDLSWNSFDHSIATSWFWKATSLKYLNLQANRLSGQFPDALGNMTSLQVLDVSENWNKYLMVTGNLKNLCSLNILDFSNNEINGDIAVMMGGLPECAWESLQELDFSYNSLTGTLPNLIGTFSSLRRLKLNKNNLTGSIPPGIGYLTCLAALDLSNNCFSGSVPFEIGSLTNLSSLDLSNNNFSGIVPSEIGALSDLTSLVLSKNNFSGVIKETHFAGLKGLKNIDLSSNSLKIEVVPIGFLPSGWSLRCFHLAEWVLCFLPGFSV
ncbi:unnamed protein product [Triticum turgidum subsp. durum]|uniref:Leucine-rich repeat-containing N-terminal plant-type domain-containing protein n=1 Tax=Triticum turgidum subsp. durum TaxID=4567 RepID=A0A9R1BI58_TRITD|nr:unnamed protein product [Triticum turgidum subsp. durum]